MAAPNIAPEVVSSIVTAMIYRPDGVTLSDIIAAFPEPPERQQVERWVKELADAGLIDVEMTAKPKRYHARKAAMDYVAGAAPAAPIRDKSTDQSSVAREVTSDRLPAQTGERLSSSALPPSASSATPRGESPTQEKAQSAPVGGTEGLNVGKTERLNPDEKVTPEATEQREFSALFEGQIYSIVIGMMPRSAALIVLQTAANQALPSGQRRGFVHYGLDRLSRLGLGECIRLGLEPEQYEVWRRQFFAIAAGRLETPKADGAVSHPDGEIADESEAGDAARKRSARGSSAPETPGQLIAKVIDAALGSSAVSANSAAPVFSDRRSSANAPVLPKRSVNTAVRMLFNWLESIIPGGISPALKGVLVTLAAALFFGLLPLISGSPWFLFGLALIVAAGAVAFAKAGWGSNAKVNTNPNARPDANPSTKANANPDSNVNANHDSSPDARGDSNPNSRRTAYLIAAGCLITGAIVAGIVAYWRIRQRPSTAAISAHVTTALAPLPVRVVALEVSYPVSGTVNCTLIFQAQVETTEPLYQRVNPAEYLRTHAPNELGAIDAANALLSGANGARLRAAVGANPSSAGPLSVQELVLITTQTRPRKSALAGGTLQAWRQEGDWQFSGDVRFDRSQFGGETKPAGAAVFAVDLPADVARLKENLVQKAAYAAKVQAAATALSAELERDRQVRIEAFVRLLQPGTLFTGVAVDAVHADAQRLVLEVADSSATTHRVSAVLRNDGGWSDARPFQGEWTLGADDEACALTLRTRTADRIEGAGPWLEDHSDRSITLQIRADGTATVSPGNWQLRRIDPAAAADLKAEFSRPIAESLAATKVGALYRGTATSRVRGTTETLLLRFIEQSPDGALIRATLASTTVPGQARSFRGTIIGNTYRAGRTRIRLRSLDNDRVREADSKSALGINTMNDSLTPGFRVEAGRLVGEDDRFSYQFAPTEDQAADEPNAERVKAGTLKLNPTESAASPAPAVSNSPASNAAVGNLAAGRSADPANGVSVQPINQAPDSRLNRAPALPPFPAVSGAFVLADGRWVTLPRNNGHVIQSTAQALSAKLAKLQRWEDALAGKSDDKPAQAFADLTFDGRDAVPAVPAKDLVMVYIGSVPSPSPDALVRYPWLKTYPAIELAATVTQRNGARMVALVLVAPGYIAIGPKHLEATVEQTSIRSNDNSTDQPAFILRCTTSPAPGRYVLFCGEQSYEVDIR
jgi:hypothetical protein